MARRRAKQGDGGGVIVLAVVIATCVAFFFILPAAILVWWVVAEGLSVGQRHLRALADVGPTATESAHRARLASEIADIEARIDAAQCEGDKHQLRRRSDGMFDQRSYLGRDLNVRLEADGRRLDHATSLRDDHDGVVGARVERWVRRKAQVAGARAGIVTFAVVAAATLGLQPAVAVSVGGLNFLVGDADAHTRMLLGSLAIAGCCALAANVAVFVTRRRELLR